MLNKNVGIFKIFYEKKLFILIFYFASFLGLSFGYDSTRLPLEDSISFSIIKRFVSDLSSRIGISRIILNFSDGTRVLSTFEENDITKKGCDPSEKWAIIVHGWTESIDIHWLQDTLSNLTVYRGGCIVVMDYHNHSRGDYFILVTKFFRISDVLVKKLNQFKSEGFDFDLGYMFGFSFGGREYSFNNLHEISKVPLFTPPPPYF